jgi:hypothetical protein
MKAARVKRRGVGSWAMTLQTPRMAVERGSAVSLWVILGSALAQCRALDRWPGDILLFLPTMVRVIVWLILAEAALCVSGSDMDAGSKGARCSCSS